jgi:hypothetical protein
LFRNASEFPQHYEEIKKQYTLSHKTDDSAQVCHRAHSTPHLFPFLIQLQEMVKIDMQKRGVQYEEGKTTPLAKKLKLQRLISAPTPVSSPSLSHMHIPAHIPTREPSFVDALERVHAAMPRVSFAAQVEEFPAERSGVSQPAVVPASTPASPTTKADYDAVSIIP